jgi:hypothetical protein
MKMTGARNSILSTGKLLRNRIKDIGPSTWAYPFLCAMRCSKRCCKPEEAYAEGIVAINGAPERPRRRCAPQSPEGTDGLLYTSAADE